MDIITVLSYAIFIATVVTIVMAAISYAAFKIRDWRKPDSKRVAAAGRGDFDDTLFFRKYELPAEESQDRDSRS